MSSYGNGFLSIPIVADILKSNARASLGFGDVRGVIPYLRQASISDLEALGESLKGDEFLKARQLLNDLMRKVRSEPSGLVAETGLDNKIITFKSKGMVFTKKPLRKLKLRDSCHLDEH